MSTIDELFAPKFLDNGELTEEVQAKMAEVLGCDSLRYLPVDSIAKAINLPPNHLCRACITTEYPSPCGQKLYQIAVDNYQNGHVGRTYEKV
jgi:amidophosphoribosyltransferase